MHLTNTLVCFEREYFYHNRRAIAGCFFQFIAEKTDRLKLCDNGETLEEELIF